MNRYVAVIDLGKSNSKLALVDTHSAQELHVTTQPAKTDESGLYPAIDHLVIERFLADAFRQLCNNFQVDAITVTTHGATAALLDENGQLALPVLDYECASPDELNDDYQKLRPVFSDTGSPRLPGGLNIGAQLYWQQTRFPDEFAKAQTLLTWPMYWVYRLTGHKYNDVTSLGCHTDLYLPHQQCYSELVHHMHWTNLMPPTKHSGELVGRVSKTTADRFGLPAQLPVYTGIHDSNASLAPYLLKHKGSFTVISTGTWFISMAMGGDQMTLEESKDTLINVNAIGDTVPSARFMGGREYQILMEGVDARKPDDLQRFFDTSDSAPPLQLMPSVVANTGPFPDLQHRWLGKTCGNEKLQGCAVAMYLALMTEQCMKLIGSRGPTYIEGPLAHDKVFTAMLMAASGRTVHISESTTGTSVGAAMLINAPRTHAASAAIELDQATELALKQYALQWQANLRDHVEIQPESIWPDTV